MINVFEVFLPQLLRYPNASDPLNGEAAALMLRHPKEYEMKVKGMFGSSKRFSTHPFYAAASDYVQRYATREAGAGVVEEEEEEDAEMSEVGSMSGDEEEETAGHMDI